METYLYRLSFKGPVHFGMEGIGLEAVDDHLPSDSLTSALINAAAILDGPEGATRMVDALKADSPAFVLSSLFPYGPDPADSKKSLDALVKPLIDPPVSLNHGALRKEWKRLRYLHPEDFLCCLENNELGTPEMEAVLERSGKLTAAWWKEDIRPRVALDRISQGSALWNQAAIFFSREEKEESGGIKKAGSGLYGLVRFNDPTWMPSLEAAFRLLGDIGLGGERTYGLGSFHFKGFEAPDDLWKRILTGRGRRHVLFSVFYPRQGEREMIGNVFESWEIRERRGYIVTGRKATTIKRKRVRMITEGSVTRQALRGLLADVTPEGAEGLGLEHKVFRSGIAFFVPWGGGG